MSDALFVGRFDRQVDDKGRLAIPSRFRTGLGERCYLAQGVGSCVTIVPEATFAAEAASMRAKVDSGELPRNHLRAVAGTAQLVVIDRQGRVSIDDHLREYAGITATSTVTVAGAFDRLEIWTPERYARLHAGASGEMAGGAE